MENKLTGSVENIVFSSRESGFAVLDLGVGDELITVVGDLAGAAVGEKLTVYGEFVNHTTFGQQFKASAAERVLPSGGAAIQKYLENGAIQGIGPATAKRLVKLFGDETLAVLTDQPERVAAIKGISRKKADSFSQELKRINGIQSVLRSLGELGFETAEVLALYRFYGDAVDELVRDNPYLVCGFPLYCDFSVADGVAAKLEHDFASRERVRAGLIFILRHNAKNGHTCLPADPLLNKATAFLDLGRDDVEIALYEDVENGIFAVLNADGEEYIFLPAMFAAESFIAERLHLLGSLQFKTLDEPDKLIDQFEKQNNIEYADLQREAIRQSLASGAVIITGGPGTGKTTALNAIITLCEQQGDKVALAAPTGRAAKRLTELTGREAKTIHRLLEVSYARDGEEVTFVHNEQNPLKYDVVVIDEMSMVDVALFEALLRGIFPQCRLIMVGDFNQLPSVGPGNLLRDLIECGQCPAVELQKIFRQAAKSLIVVNAHKIVAGEMPDLDSREKDFFFLETPNEQALRLVCDLAASRLPRAYKLDPFSDIQVLSPQRKGALGTLSLNEALRERLNPARAGRREARIMGLIYREGDRVMQVRNNYDMECHKQGGEVTLGVFNGDIGIIKSVDREAGIVTVLYDDKTVHYPFDIARQLEPAFATTVHKSQGSEFPVVLLSVCDISPKLCYRNLLYTAVTRAKQLLVIVGQHDVVESMVENDRKMLRFTGLCNLLAE